MGQVIAFPIRRVRRPRRGPTDLLVSYTSATNRFRLWDRLVMASVALVAITAVL